MYCEQTYIRTLGSDRSQRSYAGNRPEFYSCGAQRKVQRKSPRDLGQEMENQVDREENLVEIIRLREYTCLWKVNATQHKDAIAK